MKIAQEIRAGNVIMHGKDPMVVLKTEYARGGRGAASQAVENFNKLYGLPAALALEEMEGVL